MYKHYLGKFEVTDWAVNAVLYVYILMNQWIATNTTGRCCLKIIKRVVSHIFFTSYARNVCLQLEGKHVDAGTMSPTTRSVNRVIQICPHVLEASFQSIKIQDLGICWRWTFRACSIMMWLSTIDDFWDNNCQSCLWLKLSIHSFIKMYMLVQPWQLYLSLQILV